MKQSHFNSVIPLYDLDKQMGPLVKRLAIYIEIILVYILYEDIFLRLDTRLDFSVT